jgi:hypothetical protein
LRGGSRTTNQYHSSDKRLRQCTATKESVTGAKGRGKLTSRYRER